MLQVFADQSVMDGFVFHERRLYEGLEDRWADSAGPGQDATLIAYRSKLVSELRSRVKVEVAVLGFPS